MKATVPYIEKKFEEYNQQMFAGVLPKLPIEISDAKTFLGVCVFRVREKENGKKEFFDFKLRINTRVDLPEEVIEDTIIHEMIHYYIGYKQIEDVSAHGPLFVMMMNMINEKFGRHLTISHKSASEEEAREFVDKTARWHVIAIISLSDGKKGVKVLPRIIQRVTTFYTEMLKDPKIGSIDLYLHNDPYFNQFPNSKTLDCRIVGETEFLPHLNGAKRLLCDGKNLKEVK